MHSLDDLFQRLSHSPFRQRFKLGSAEYQYCLSKGDEVIRQHATDFISARLAPAEPPNDGRQTPMRGHPVFIAQHATATCCRSCLYKWHGVNQHQEMTAEQQARAIAAILRWLHQEMQRPAPPAKPANRNTPVCKKSRPPSRSSLICCE
ncbi:DUF4186 domain-containing protein [Erwinia tasmaniensis]|uniref:DUF4186 domain-containing protein n=1 Tax=Erwinia tasmaniensis TaxID=338565 RepID=UPI003A4DB5AB